MLRRIVLLLVAFPAAALLITLAIANRHAVRLVLDPFRPEAPVVSMLLPFYAYLFGTLFIGILLGGTAVWMGQGRWRRTARNRAQEAMRWQAEADRLARERDATVAASEMPVATRGKLVAIGGR
ncbi:MAG: hypothetical protein ABL908_04745 [Hyphomicrobium sp.]